MGRLAALVPKPRVNLTRFHGVFSRGGHPPNSKLREHVVPGRLPNVKEPKNLKAYALTWAQRLRRVFAIEIEKCEKCGGPVKIIASIEERNVAPPEVIRKILAHLGLDRPQETHNRSPPAGLFDASTALQ